MRGSVDALTYTGGEDTAHTVLVFVATPQGVLRKGSRRIVVRVIRQRRG